MMNELAKVENPVGKYLALVPNSDAAEALAANMSRGEMMTEADLLRVKTPAGGGTKWCVPEISGDEYLDELTGILVYYSASGTLWPSDDQKPGTLPVLKTSDLVHAERVGDELGDIDPNALEECRIPGTDYYDWRLLPWNQWGSGKGGVGKRCKESRILCLLRENDLFPIIVRAQPGSLRTVAPMIKRLPVPHWRAIVSLKLQSAESKGGQRYSQIVARFVGAIDRETGDRVKALYTDKLAEQLSKSYDVDVADFAE